MKACAALSSVAFAALLMVGCRQETPAQKALAVDAKGRALVLKGQYPQAITLYSTAIESDGTKGAVYFHRGTARMLDASTGGVSDLNDAIADFTMAIRLDPLVRPSAYRARGDAKHLKGDEEGAKQDWAQGSASGQ
jgi:tetratricopeptide (TPR) repeat protein